MSRENALISNTMPANGSTNKAILTILEDPQAQSETHVTCTRTNEETGDKEDVTSSERRSQNQNDGRMDAGASANGKTKDEKHFEHINGIDNNDDSQDKKHNDDDGKDDDDNDNGESSRRRDGMPVDRGWAWMITVGAFVIFLVFQGQNLLLSILLLDIVENFQTTLTVTNTMLSLKCLGYSIGCQAGLNIFGPRMSIRKMIVSGSVFNALTSCMLVFVPNMPLFMVVNFFKFFCHGVVLMPTLTLVGLYFKRRRALASSLTLLGLSVAALVVPVLIRFLRDQYGFRGCFLLMAAIEMQAIVGASLLRPPSSYPSKAEDNDNAKNQESHHSYSSLPQVTDDDATHQTKIHQACSATKGQHHSSVSSHGHERCAMLDQEEGTQPSIHLEIPSPRCQQRQKAGSGQIVQTSLTTLSCGPNQTPRIRLMASNSNRQDKQNGRFFFSRSAEDINLKMKAKPLTTSLIKIDANDDGLPGKTNGVRNGPHNTSSFEFLSWISPSSSLSASALSIAEIEQITAKDKNTTTTAITTNTKTNTAKIGCPKLLKAMFDFSVLRSWAGVVYISSYILARSVSFTATFIPAYATEAGLDATQAASLLAIHGGVDVVSKLCFGVIGDLHLTRPKYIIAATCVLMFVISLFANFYTTFPLMIFFSGASGFFGSVCLSLNTNNIIDMNGIDKLGPFLSQSSQFLNLAQMLQFPILGVLMDATGMIVTVFFYVAVCYLLSAALVIVHEIASRLVSRRNSNGQDEHA